MGIAFDEWRILIGKAAGVERLTAVTKDYVGSVPYELLRHLPAECQEAFRSAHLNVMRAAIHMLRCELMLRGGEHYSREVHEIAHTLLAIAHRLDDLEGQQPPPDYRRE